MKKTSEDSFIKKTFFPKFKLLNSGCGLSADAAYLRVFTVMCDFMSRMLAPGNGLTTTR